MCLKLTSLIPGGGWGGGGGVLGISSDGDDRRIFFRFEIFDSGIWVGKFGKYCFWGGLI